MSEWWAVMWNVKPGTEQEVEDLFRNYGRPDTVVKNETARSSAGCSARRSS